MHSQPAARLRIAKILSRPNQHIVVGPRCEPRTEMTEHADMFGNALIAETDIQRNRGQTGITASRELIEKGIIAGPQRHAGVIVPHHRVLRDSAWQRVRRFSHRVLLVYATVRYATYGIVRSTASLPARRCRPPNNRLPEDCRTRAR